MDWTATYLGNTLTAWATALGLVAAVSTILPLILRILVGRIRSFANRTETDLDDLALGLLERTRFLVVFVIALAVGTRPLTLPDVLDTVLHAVLQGAILLQAGFWATAVVNWALDRYRRKQVEDDPGLATALGAVGFIARAAVWVLLVLTFLKTALDVDITAFIASLGVGGIAVALALQNVFSDLLASLSIILDKPFVIGDFVVVGDMAGTVENVGLKTTRIRSLSGEQLVFSNSDLLASRIRNYKRMDERRIVFQLGVIYGTPQEKLKQIPQMVREVVETLDNTRFDRSHFKAFGAFSLDFESVYFMTVPDYNAYMDTQHAINLELYRRFEEAGIEFAYPTQTLFVEGVGGGGAAAAGSVAAATGSFGGHAGGGSGSAGPSGDGSTGDSSTAPAG